MEFKTTRRKTTRRWIGALLLLGALLAAAACAAKEEAKPAAPAPAGAGAAAPEAILPRKDAWQEEWEQVLAAAKREGKVALAGPVGAELRRALTEPFEKKYGITVEYLPQRGAEFGARLTTERQAGQYLWDVFIGGSSTPLVTLRPLNALDPLVAAFILPEVKDLKNWRGGKYPYLDKAGREVFAMTAHTGLSFLVNSKVVKPEEFKSWKDLLDPKWKGKITVADPTVSGSGQGKFQFLYLHPELGPDFIRALVRQDLLITRDGTTQLQWVAAGRYLVCIGCSDAEAEPMISAGAPLVYTTPLQMKEGGHIGTANGSLALFNRASHPNAAKVYINWLLSKEGATEFIRAAGRYVSTRVDVPPLPGYEWAVPRATDIPLDTEEARLQRAALVPFFKEVLGR